MSGYAPVIAYLAEAIPSTEFRVIDVGCGGGIDSGWRSWGSRLRVLGLDSNIAEVERLRRVETHPGVEYLAGRAVLPPDHPFALRKAGRDDLARDPWPRLSVATSVDIERLQGGRPAAPEMIAVNDGPANQPPDRPIVVPDLLRSRGITSADFLKIDVDGRDFEILNSFDAALDAFGILGLGIEVNFFGSACDTDHTFHNVDRFMKARGFALFNLTTRRYSVAALPSRYVLDFPAQTEFGRPLQGDALYIRDLADPAYDDVVARLDTPRLLNLVSIFATFDLPDCGAEIVLRYRDRVAALCDVNHVLDLLAAQARGPVAPPLGYQELIERFERRDPMFFSAGDLPERRQILALMREMERISEALRAREEIQLPEDRLPTEMHRSRDAFLTGLQRAQNTMEPRLTLPILAKVVRLSEEIQAREGEIAAMKSSKFWKLRTGWFRVKRALGLDR